MINRPGALSPRRRWSLVSFSLMGIAGAIVVLAAIELAYGVLGPPNWKQAIGDDLAYYASLAHRLFTGGGWYPDRELQGPWQINYVDDVLYPPAAAWLFAPFIVLPVGALLAIAVIVIGWLVRAWRPAPWTWPLMALCLAWPTTLLRGISGNSSLFVVIAFGLGLRYGWPAVAILVKPSLFPLAMIGIRSRGWWVGLGVLALISLPFIGDTLAYPRVIADSRNPDGILYSLIDLPLILIPLIAWLGRTSRADEQGSGTHGFENALGSIWRRRWSRST
jgi:hypothetical protein